MTESATSVQELGVKPTYEQIIAGIKHSGVQEILRHARKQGRGGYPAALREEAAPAGVEVGNGGWPLRSLAGWGRWPRRLAACD
jgi:hypothetical protein